MPGFELCDRRGAREHQRGWGDVCNSCWGWVRQAYFGPDLGEKIAVEDVASVKHSASKSQSALLPDRQVYSSTARG